MQIVGVSGRRCSVPAASRDVADRLAGTSVTGWGREPAFQIGERVEDLGRLPASSKALLEAIKDAEKRTGEHAARRLTETTDDGARRFVENPPVMTHVDPEIRSRLHGLFEQYLDSAYVDIRMLMTHYSVDDVVRRVVGVGSVGTRCYIVLLDEPGGTSLILQAKEAGTSVLESYGEIVQPPALKDTGAHGGQGARVVGLQRILQAYSDPFLGHLRSPAGDFDVRQFHDMKGSIDVEERQHRRQHERTGRARYGTLTKSSDGQDR